jgi:hypothetical protein
MHALRVTCFCSTGARTCSRFLTGCFSFAVVVFVCLFVCLFHNPFPSAISPPRRRFKSWIHLAWLQVQLRRSGQTN